MPGKVAEAKPGQLYEEDFAVWLERQAQLLRERRFDELDVENLVEEVEDIGRSQRRAVESNLRIILIHLLKYQFQPERRTQSWLDSLLEHHDRLARDFKDSPSLRRYAQEELAEAYRVARKRASAQTRLSPGIFPEHCPYSFEQVLDEDFLPE